MLSCPSYLYPYATRRIEPMQHQAVYKAFHPHPELISNAILGCRDAHPFFSITLLPLLVRRAQAVIEPPGATQLVAPLGKEHSILWATGAYLSIEYRVRGRHVYECVRKRAQVWA